MKVVDAKQKVCPVISTPSEQICCILDKCVFWKYTLTHEQVYEKIDCGNMLFQVQLDGTELPEDEKHGKCKLYKD